MQLNAAKCNPKQHKSAKSSSRNACDLLHQSIPRSVYVFVKTTIISVYFTPKNPFTSAQMKNKSYSDGEQCIKTATEEEKTKLSNLISMDLKSF